MEATELLGVLLEGATLKWIPRMGWRIRGVPNGESVADHSFGVAWMALVVADTLAGEGGRAADLDLEKLLALAVIHDLGEVRLTDLPATAARLLSAEVKRDAEEKALSGLLDPLPRARRWKALWREFEEGSTPEGRLIRDLDKLEMMVQCLRYELAGSGGLEEFWTAMDGFDWSYELCEALYGGLKALRRRSGAGEPERASSRRSSSGKGTRAAVLDPQAATDVAGAPPAA